MFSTRAICLFAAILLFGKINGQVRVEPSNWWTGMKNPELQLLVQAENIGLAAPVISYPGVTIRKIHRADSPNYVFLDLLISKTTKPGSFPIIFRRDGKTVQRIEYTLSRRNKAYGQTPGFNSSDVIYLITPDRFANGDRGNDSVATLRESKLNRSHDYGRHGGDLRGMIDHLDYIASMGFTAIWPTPVLENDMAESSYHGYAITDYYKVDPRFGTLDEYKELADGLRARGMKLIFDAVANHCGSRHWWMEDLPFHNWINYPDSVRNTNHRREVHQDPYASSADRELMVKGWFVRSMPDLNQDNPFVATYIIQNNIWWIETLGLAGIRQDTYPYSQKKFLEKWTCSIMNEYPNFSIVAEEWSTNPLRVAYWQKGKASRDDYNGCLKSTMDFPLQEALVKALTEAEGWNGGLKNLYEALTNDFAYVRPQDLMVFGDNHDMDRLFTQLNNDPDLMQMALGYLLTIRGIPKIYYGTEVLLHNSDKKGDDGRRRREFPGGWEGDPVNGFSGNGLTADQSRTQIYLKKLLNWRKGKKVIYQGKTMHFSPERGVYVYFRYDKTEKVMVILNKNKETTELSLNRFAEMLSGLKTARNIESGEETNLVNSLQVKPKSVTILELR